MKHKRKKVVRKMLSVVLAVATVMTVVPVSSVMAEDQNIAQVGNTKYSNVKDAWEAVKAGGTLELLKDWDTRSYGRLYVNEKATVIINMNGHSINRHIASDKYENSVKDGEVFFVQKNAVLTINGGSNITHNGRISNGVWYEDANDGSDPIEGGVIVGGNSTNGAGGIHVKEGANVNLNDVTLAGNMADKKYGGGLRLDGKNINLTLNNSHIMYNCAKGYGGGIYVDSKNCSIDLKNSSSISYNFTDKDDGGAMYSNAEYTSVTMDDSSEISYNIAQDKGGGFYFNYSKVSVKGGTFKNNKSYGGGGGAIYLEHYQNASSTDSVAIANVTFTGNSGAGDGGAIHSEQEYVNFSACTITGNTAQRDGGGIYIYNDKNTITGCTITGNTAGERGGGVFVNSQNDLGLGGKVIIDDNKVAGEKNNLYLEVGTWTASCLESAPGAGSKIGVTVPNDKIINSSSGNYAEKYFYADDSENQHIEEDDNGCLYMRKGASVDVSINEVGPTIEKVENDIIKGYFSYPSIMDTKSDIDGTYYYSDSYFKSQDSKSYNRQLATMSICMAMAAFNSNVGNGAEGGTDYTLKSKNIVKLLNDIGVKRDDIYLSNTYTIRPGTGTIGVAIGQKKLGDDGEILVPIAVRGAGYESEWTSNVTVGTGNTEDKEEHVGFADAANQVFEQVQSYIQDYGLSEDVNKGKVKFWVTGYSRAGATANLTARRLVDTYGTDKVFAYCMEAPKGALEKENNTTKYANIHNCINYNDPVPKVAPGYMGFTRYGKDEIFNENTNKETKAKVKQQLKAVSDDIVYNDRLYVGTIDLFESSVENMIFSLKADMIRPVSNPTDNAPTNLGDYMDQFVTKFQDWAIGNRAAYTTAPTGDNDLRENDSSLKNVSFEESLQLIMPMVFSKSDEEISDMMDIAMKRANELSMVKIYFGPILGKWQNQSKTTKQDWIWNKLWYQIVEPSGKEGLASKLTPKELTDLKTAWPTLIDRVFTFVSKDYKFEDWALAFTVVGNQVVQRLSDPGLNVLGTMAYNSEALMQAHYPEVNYAWLRSMDDHYKENETRPVKIKTDKEPTVSFNLDKGSYEGDQTLKLVAGEDTKGEGIYYKLTTTVNGNSTETTWLPYNKGITLSAVTNDAGEKIKATYKVDVRAVFCNNEITASKTYEINPVTFYNVTVKDKDGTEIQSNSYAASEKVTISAPNLENKFFTGWTEADGIELKEADKSKETLVFNMPERNVTLTASYKNLIDEVKVEALEAPTGKNAFNKKANVILNGNNEVVEEQKVYDVIWTTVDAQGKPEVVADEKADFNTSYEAVIVLKPEAGKREFAKTMKVVVKGEQTGKTELQKDGSIWVYCGTMLTGNPKFISTQTITITAKTGTENDNLGLPKNILIETEAGPKIATVDEWVCQNYQKDQAGKYTFTANINLSACGVDPAEEATNAVAKAEVNLEQKAKAATPVLKEKSAVPGKYKENQTIYLETATAGATIKYKLGDAGQEQTYDPDKGILLSIPEDAKSGTVKTYKITAYAEPANTSETDKSEAVIYEYEIAKPYTVTISYKDTGFAQENPWTKEATVTSCIPGEDAYIIAPEETDEQFAEWETNDESGIKLSETDKESKLIKVEKINTDISLTAVYNPVVHEISLTIPSPATGEKLAKTVSSCSARITNTYDVLKTFGLTIPITWTPAGNDGTASAYQTYTAKMSMSMDSTAAKFYLGDQATVLVKDARDESKNVSSTWNIEKDKDGKDILVVYATFEKTSKVKAVSVTQPDSVQAEYGETIEGIKSKLADKVQVTLADGTVTQATVQWEDTIESYNPKVATEQVGTIKGTITFPDYVDGNGISEVSTEVYVSAAAKTTAPTASIASGVYATAQKVTLVSEEGATIYYSTDGLEPTIDEAHKYNGNAISITEEATTLKAFAVKEGKQNSITSSYSYYIHKHVDANGDGKCDGIYTGKDESGQGVYETCDTVLLGRSNDADGVEASVAGTIAQDDGKGTIYVEVNRDDIVENVEKSDAIQDNTTQEDTTEANDTQDATWKYSNDVYPTTKLKYAYKPEGSDDNTATTDHGYIFAGWYRVEKTTKEGDDGEKQTTIEMKPYDKMPTETAYAKFVDATVLSVKAQVLASTSNQSETTDMRVLTSIDGVDYQSMGFDIYYNDKVLSYSSSKAYKKVYAMDGKLAVEKTPKEVFRNNLSKGFLAFRIMNIPNSMFDTELNVVPYWITKDGTKVTGVNAIKKVSDSPELSINK